jgi:hypothetical protein
MKEIFVYYSMMIEALLALQHKREPYSDDDRVEEKTFLALFQVPSRNFLLHTFFWHGLVIEHAEWGNYAITKLFLILLLGGLERKVKLQPHTKIN